MLRIDIWSDIACPWCYIGKRRLERALDGFAHAAEVEIVWRSFELDPAAPRVHDATRTFAERLAAKYRTTPAQAEQMIARVVTTAAQDGLTLRYDHIRPGNTFDAHRLLHLAHARGAQGALKERLMRGYQTEGAAIGDPAALAGMAADAGLPAADVAAVLDSDQYAAEVRSDQALARELGITGVPFFVFGGQLAVSGAQPTEVLRGALERAWAALPAAPDAGEAGSCGADGCC